MAAHGRETNRAAQRAHTRRRIVEVSLDLFSRQGYASTSLKQISDELGLAKSAVYYHFQTKAQILDAITEPGYASAHALMTHLTTLTSRTERYQALVTGFTEVLIASRAKATLIAYDPAVRTQEPYLTLNIDLRERLLAAVYGPDVTHEARYATFAAISLPEAIASSPELSDDDLRTLLTSLLTRLFPTPP